LDQEVVPFVLDIEVDPSASDKEVVPRAWDQRVPWIKMTAAVSSSFLPFLFLVVFQASATTIDIDGVSELEDEYSDGDARTVFTSGGTYYIALNTTYLLYYSLIAGALLLAGLALSGHFSGSADSTGYGHQYSYQEGYQGYGQKAGSEGSFRNKRQAYSQDFTDQLHILADAFNKYEVDETTCQLYVACESAIRNRHTKHGRLAKTVYQVMRTIEQPENTPLYRDDAYLMDILDAFKIGASGQSCGHLRKQCRKQKIFLDQ